jgi:Cu/Ag efflux protein CusF
MKHLLLFAALFAASPLWAQQSATDPSANPTATAALSDGEVRKVDLDAKKITLRHGPIPNLDMPPMTMVFEVKEPAMLNAVKTGDKVKFAAEKSGSAYIVTRIEAAK